MAVLLLCIKNRAYPTWNIDIIMSLISFNFLLVFVANGFIRTT